MVLTPVLFLGPTTGTRDACRLAVSFPATRITGPDVYPSSQTAPIPYPQSTPCRALSHKSATPCRKPGKGRRVKAPEHAESSTSCTAGQCFRHRRSDRESTPAGCHCHRNEGRLVCVPRRYLLCCSVLSSSARFVWLHPLAPGSPRFECVPRPPRLVADSISG